MNPLAFLQPADSFFYEDYEDDDGLEIKLSWVRYALILQSIISSNAGVIS